MRQWKIYLGQNPDEARKKFQYLERAKQKGITGLSNVKIYFDASHLIIPSEELNKEMLSLLTAWEDKIVGLDIKHGSYYSHWVALDLPNLERLQETLSTEMMMKHSEKLKELTLDDVDVDDMDNFGSAAPNLKCLTLNNNRVRSLKPILDYSYNITKLVLYRHFIFNYCRGGPPPNFNFYSDNLKLCNLHELIIFEDFADYYLLVNDNSECLETLHLAEIDCLFHDVTFEPLPNLKTLVLYGLPTNHTQTILKASPSIETLICQDLHDFDGIKLSKLSKLITCVSTWSISMMLLNAETLESIVLDVDSSLICQM